MSSLLEYINNLGEIPPVKSLRHLTDEQYIHYTELRKKEYQTRTDKFKKRGKYYGSLSVKHRSYINKCNAKGIDFELTAKEFEDLVAGICVYCLQPATGIDRRDSKKGYTLSNSQSCCGRCNLMKRDMTEDTFIEQCQRIVSVWNSKQY
jgi:hypothetical protein